MWKVTMNWTTVTGITPSDVSYEAVVENGVQLRVNPIFVNDWPAFRWSVDINIPGHRSHKEDVAVDLLAAKHAAENFAAQSLNGLKQH
jgi:hypothetical protein